MVISPWSKLSMYQEYFDEEVKRGIVFSLLWILGMGSVIGIIKGIRARIAVVEAGKFLKDVPIVQERMTGQWKMWLCFTLSIAGILLTVLLIRMVVLKVIK